VQPTRFYCVAAGSWLGAVDFREELGSFWRAKRSEIGGQFELALALGGKSLDLCLETKLHRTIRKQIKSRVNACAIVPAAAVAVAAVVL